MNSDDRRLAKRIVAEQEENNDVDESFFGTVAEMARIIDISLDDLKELPKNQRRDTACPFTYKNETRHRIKKWPDIIGIGAPKCGIGKLYSLIPETYDPS